MLPVRKNDYWDMSEHELTDMYVYACTETNNVHVNDERRRWAESHVWFIEHVARQRFKARAGYLLAQWKRYAA